MDLEKAKVTKKTQKILFGALIALFVVATLFFTIQSTLECSRTETIEFQGFKWVVENIGSCKISDKTTIYNTLSKSDDGISVYQEANTNGESGESVVTITLKDVNIREKDKVELFTIVNGQGSVNGGGGISAIIRDENGQELSIIGGSKGCGTGGGCTWSFGAISMLISSDKKQIVGRVEQGTSNAVSTAHLGEEWTLILRPQASGTKWGGATQTTKIRFIDILPKSVEKEQQPTIPTPMGEQQQVISPTAIEEKTETGAVAEEPVEQQTTQAIRVEPFKINWVVVWSMMAIIVFAVAIGIIIVKSRKKR